MDQNHHQADFDRQPERRQHIRLAQRLQDGAQPFLNAPASSAAIGARIKHAHIDQHNGDQGAPDPHRALETGLVPCGWLALMALTVSPCGCAACSQPTNRIRLKAMATITIDTALAPRRFSDSTSPSTYTAAVCE